MPSHFHGKINLNNHTRYIRNAATHRHTLAYTTNTHTDTYAHRQTATHTHTHLTGQHTISTLIPTGWYRKATMHVTSILSTTKFTLNIKASIISKVWLTSLMLQAIKDNTQAMPTIGRSNPRHSFSLSQQWPTMPTSAITINPGYPLKPEGQSTATTCCFFNSFKLNGDERPTYCYQSN